MKCILLVRVSTEKQDFEEQEREIHELAKKDGYDDADIISVAYKESGRSLSEEERLGLIEMKRLIENDDVNCVYAWEISRIARTKKVLFSIADYLQKRKIQLVIKKPSLRMLTTDGEIDEGAESIFTLFAQIAESEMRNKLDRFSRGKKAKAREGIYTGGKLPYGYKISGEKNKKIEIDDAQADIVRKIYNMYEQGISQSNIAIELEKIGILGMKISLINHILKNIHYTGILFKRKDVFSKKRNKIEKYNERIYPPIISTEQFNKCRQIAIKNNTVANKTRNIYFAENLVHCQTCGTKWSASGSRVAYHCYNSAKSKKVYKYEYNKKEQCKNKTSISINLLDSLLWNVAMKEEASYILSDKKEKIEIAQKEISVIDDKINAIRIRLEDIEKKKKRAHRVFIDGHITENEYDELLLDCKEKINSIKNEEISYISEKERITGFIKKITEETCISKRFRSYGDYLNELKEINDEQQMYDIIHKHISDVTIEPISFTYKFAIGEKETRAKRIRIQTFSGILHDRDYQVYIYIPFDGIGGITTLKERYDSNSNPYYEKEIFLHLKRYEDPRKVQLKEERKRKREEKLKGIKS